MRIIEDNLEGPEIASLLLRHLEHAFEHSPPESVHALDLGSLKSPEITFWSCWDGTDLMGCGALKELNPTEGEIKSMRTVDAHLRKGVASRILSHIIEVARERSYSRLFLETGSMDTYKPAQALYLRFGFEFCEPFEGYVEDPNSLFMSLEVSGEKQTVSGE